MLSLKPSVLAWLVGGLCVSSALVTAPSKPTLGRGEITFFFIAVVDQAATFCNTQVKVHTDGAPVSVSWHFWSGDIGQTAKVLLDGKAVWAGAASRAGTASWRSTSHHGGEKVSHNQPV